MALPKKIWKENGPEQVERNKLFESGKIDESSLPNTIRQGSLSFMEFPSKTFAAHFRKTKIRYGAYATNYNDDHGIVIPELGTSQNASNELNKKRKLDVAAAFCDDNSDVKAGVTFNNPPYMSWLYFDHVQKVEIVSVAIPTISGSQNVDFGLSEDGWQLIVKYTWPAALYSPELLFIKKVATHPMTHPQVHSFASEVLERGFTQKCSPTGNIVVQLPVKVQREVGTWEYEGMKINGCDILLVKLKAHQKKIVIDDADTSVTFK